jgi:uncharacterized protein (TIGR03083 family)
MMGDPTWDFMNPASKGRLLGVLEREIDEMFDLAAEPERWHAPTACPGWEFRDMIGHLVTETEGYLSAFDTARRAIAAAKDPVGVTGMAKASDEAARAFRHEPHDELLKRFRDDTDRPMHEFESLSDADWSGLIVPERYFGPLPAMIIAEGILGGVTVHCWDVRESLGERHAIAGDAAALVSGDGSVDWLCYPLREHRAFNSFGTRPYPLGVAGKRGQLMIRLTRTDVPTLTTDQMREVDRAMVEDLHIELVQMDGERPRPDGARHRTRFVARCSPCLQRRCARGAGSSRTEALSLASETRLPRAHRFCR